VCHAIWSRSLSLCGVAFNRSIALVVQSSYRHIDASNHRIINRSSLDRHEPAVANTIALQSIVRSINSNNRDQHSRMSRDTVISSMVNDRLTPIAWLNSRAPSGPRRLLYSKQPTVASADTLLASPGAFNHQSSRGHTRRFTNESDNEVAIQSRSNGAASGPIKLSCQHTILR